MIPSGCVFVNLSVCAELGGAKCARREGRGVELDFSVSHTFLHLPIGEFGLLSPVEHPPSACGARAPSDEVSASKQARLTRAPTIGGRFFQHFLTAP
ncbi:hypothetical protein EVAR_58107_1 [Eumeta japonica]|uniref:Uncharacterized protein n=1 Tax=Eumeta variegata TaxID=151549 RepID=A0A4C1YJN5_EUMVA|nr:hypothetical protein EVAR_58107_1 [Eumeta japonica]